MTKEELIRLVSDDYNRSIYVYMGTRSYGYNVRFVTMDPGSNFSIVVLSVTCLLYVTSLERRCQRATPLESV